MTVVMTEQDRRWAESLPNSPRRRREVEEAMARYERGVETLWCDASGRKRVSAIAVVRARDRRILVREILHAKVSIAERFAVERAIECAAASVELGLSVLIFSDHPGAAGRAKVPPGVEVRHRIRECNLAHTQARAHMRAWNGDPRVLREVPS